MITFKKLNNLQQSMQKWQFP